MAASVDQSGNYFLVDLITKTVPYVATLPDFWVKENKKQCWYPKTLGDRTALKRKPPQPDWYLYQCRARGTFESYEAYRALEPLAAEESDFSSLSLPKLN